MATVGASPMERRSVILSAAVGANCSTASLEYTGPVNVGERIGFVGGAAGLPGRLIPKPPIENMPKPNVQGESWG